MCTLVTDILIFVVVASQHFITMESPSPPSGKYWIPLLYSYALEAFQIWMLFFDFDAVKKCIT